MRASSSRPSQRFRRYHSSRDGDCDRVRQVYAAQFVPRRIQIGLHAGERQIQKPGDVVICLASRRPDQTFLFSFRQLNRLWRQFEIDASGKVRSKTAIGCSFAILRDLYFSPIVLRIITREGSIKERTPSRFRTGIDNPLLPSSRVQPRRQKRLKSLGHPWAIHPSRRAEPPRSPSNDRIDSERIVS